MKFKSHNFKNRRNGFKLFAVFLFAYTLQLAFFSGGLIGQVVATCNEIPGADLCNCTGNANLIMDSSPCMAGSNQSQLYLLVDIVDGVISTDPDNNQIIARSNSINFNVPTGDYAIYELVFDTPFLNSVALVGVDINALISVFEALGATMPSPGMWVTPDGFSLAAGGLITVNGSGCGCNGPPCTNGGACAGGTVTCEGDAVGGVSIALYDQNTSTLLSVFVTNPDGTYSFCGLPAANYQVVVGSHPNGASLNSISFFNVVLQHCEVNDGFDFSFSNCNGPIYDGPIDGPNCPNIDASAIIECLGESTYTVILTFGGPFAESGFSIIRPDGSTIVVANTNGYTDTNVYSIPNYPTYTYSLTSLADPSCSAVVGPVIVQCGGIAIELLDFKGTQAGKANYLHWTTATESNNDSFTLMRSDNGQDFEAITTINSQGNSSTVQHYDYSDFDFRSATSYYRLVETDNNGNSKTTGDIVVVERDEFDFEIGNVYPVPTSSTLNIEFVNSREQQVEVTIYDLVGKVIERFDLASIKGNNTFDLNIEHYPVGTYLLSLSSGGAGATAKFVKE